MVYEPKTDEGKKALEAGADISVVEQMEKEGSFTPKDDDKDKKPDDKNPEEKKPTDGDKKPDDGAGEGDKDKKKDGEDDQGKKPVDRTPQSMPVWKHKEELKQAEAKIKADFEKQIGDLNDKISDLATKKGGASDDDLAKLATDLNLEPDVAATMVDRMADIIAKRTGLTDLKKSVDESAEVARKAKEEAGFVSEWTEKDTQDTIKSVAGDKPITEEVRSKVKELAYTTTYAKYRLADIIKLNADTLFPATPKESKPAEGGRGGSGRGIAKDITDMTKDEMEAMSDDEFLKLSNELGKKGSRYQFTKKKKAVIS